MQEGNQAQHTPCALPRHASPACGRTAAAATHVVLVRPARCTFESCSILACRCGTVTRSRRHAKQSSQSLLVMNQRCACCTPHQVKVQYSMHTLLQYGSAWSGVQWSVAARDAQQQHVCALSADRAVGESARQVNAFSCTQMLKPVTATSSCTTQSDTPAQTTDLAQPLHAVLLLFCRILAASIPQGLPQGVCVCRSTACPACA
jgi:hypothetical protein